MRWTKGRLAWRTNYTCIVCGKPTVYSWRMHDKFCKDCDASLAKSDWPRITSAYDTWLVARTKEYVAAQYRDRHRRVVRVFWLVRDTEGRPLRMVGFAPHRFAHTSRNEPLLEFVSREVAISNQRKYGGKIYRVTVRRVTKRGP